MSLSTVLQLMTMSECIAEPYFGSTMTGDGSFARDIIAETNPTPEFCVQVSETAKKRHNNQHGVKTITMGCKV
jgi:hypothetical protein